MKSTRLFATCLTVMVGAIVVWASTTAQGQYFRDDFEDGSATDGNPVTWVTEVPPFPEGDLRIEDGSLVLTPRPSEFYANYWETDWEVETIFPADVIVRTQVRALQPGFSYQGIYARDTHNVDARQGRSVAAMVDSTGAVNLWRVSNSFASSTVASRSLAPITTLNHDIHLELHLSGPSAMLYAWPVGSPKPSIPTLSTISGVGSSWNSPGRVGVFAGQEDDRPLVTGAFRFVEVAPLPEPGSIALIASALACCCGRTAWRQARRWSRATLAPLLFALVVAAQQSHAATIFYDDFEDGSATDGSPVPWTPRVYTNGTFQVEAGSYTLTPGIVGEPMVSVVEGWTAIDVSIRSQVRSNDSVDGIGLFARFQEGEFTYQGGIDTSGLVYIGWNGADTRYNPLAEVATTLRPARQDISLQFDVFGDLLRMYAWPEGEMMPTLPTLQVVSQVSDQAGQVGILNDPTGRTVVQFRYVHVADAPIPEPTTLGLAGMAAGAGLRRGGRRRVGTAG